MKPKSLVWISWLALAVIFLPREVAAQCGLAPGSALLGGASGCAPHTVGLRTLFFGADPGTIYTIDWGDGSPIETHTQVAGAIDPGTGYLYTLAYHTYNYNPNECTYTILYSGVRSSDGCRSGVGTTDIRVFNPDIVRASLPYVRVCEGVGGAFEFVDVSDFNCIDDGNTDPRWTQWVYGTQPASNQITGVELNNALPATLPSPRPVPPNYPVTGPLQYNSASVKIPANPLLAPVGAEFWVTLRHWNVCNPYDAPEATLPQVPPVDIVNGDSPPSEYIDRIIVVNHPEPEFTVHETSHLGPEESRFCIGETVYLTSNTATVFDAGGTQGLNVYQWEIFDGPTDHATMLFKRLPSNNANEYDVGSRLQSVAFTSAGRKLIRLRVKDANAYGDCVFTEDRIIEVIEPFVAEAEMLDAAGTPITDPLPLYCTNNAQTFSFNDISLNTIPGQTLWRWEHENSLNPGVIQSWPNAPKSSPAGFSPNSFHLPGLLFQEGHHTVRLILRDIATQCESVREFQFRILNVPVVNFISIDACDGTPIRLEPQVTFNSAFPGNSINTFEWDFDYRSNTFTIDRLYTPPTNPVLQEPFPVGVRTVAYRATTLLCAPVMQSKTVSVNPMPAPSFQLLPNQSVCGTVDLSFQNTTPALSAGTITSFTWEVDALDGSGFVPRVTLTDLANAELRFDNTTSISKDYRVRVVATTDRNCIATSQPQTIRINPGASTIGINTNYNPFDQNCSPLNSLRFEADANTVSLEPTSYTWEVSQNGTVLHQVAGTNPEYFPPPNLLVNNGTTFLDYSVKLSVALSTGCTYNDALVVRVNPVPTAAFSIQPESHCDRVVLTATATGLTNTQYLWEEALNGVVRSSGPGIAVFQETYNRLPSATQTVQLTLVTENFPVCRSTPVTMTYTVPAQETIAPQFSVQPGTSQLFPQATFNFVHDNFSNGWTYAWDYDDGTVETTQALQTTHTYTSPGNYDVKLTAAQGTCTFTSLVRVTVLPQQPVVDFEFVPASGCAPLEVRFTNRSQNVDRSSYEWDFGVDESPSYAENPVHIFERPGVYSVKLTAKDVVGGNPVTVVKHQIIEVHDKPLAYFAVKPSLVYLPGKAFMINQTLGGTRFHWDFGDGNTSTDAEPSHAYDEEGVYTVSLTAYNDQNCEDTFTFESALQVRYGGDIILPNSFIPSTIGPGNGRPEQNNVFLPLMRGVTKYNLQIFNRWGQLLFESNDQSIGWDGYYNGSLSPSDTYVYKIFMQFVDGKTVTRVGDVNLIR